MQSITPVTTDQLLQKGQQPLLKFEIKYCCCWVDLTNLGGKNYLKSISISTAGAEMTPNPVAGKWSAVIFNKNGMFDPDETVYAPYNEYFRAGVKVKIQVGAKYDGVDYYWRRIYGFMEIPDFSIDNSEVNLSGFDNMQFLANTKLREPDNYWGSSITLSTIASEETLGVEMYDEDDAMEIIADAPNVTPWDTAYGAAMTWTAPGGAPSTNVGQIVKDDGGSFIMGYIEDNNVGSVEQGKEYKVVFQYQITVVGKLSIGIYKTGTIWTAETAYSVGDTVEPTIPNANNCFYLCTVAGTSGVVEPAWPVVENGGVVDGTVTWATQYMDGKKMGEITNLSSGTWAEASFYFIATESCAIKMRASVRGASHVATTARLDVFSIKKITGFSNASYNLPDECNGVHYAVLDDEAIWPGKQKGEGWSYDPELKIFSFDDERHMDVGTDNLVIHYYTTQVSENIVADLLVRAGLYSNQAEALAAMIYTATGITIDKVWFDAGKTCLNAVKMFCERCNYRFYFNYSQRPVFKPTPTPKGAGSEDFSFLESHIAGIRDYEDRNEIRNRIVIEGIEQALPEGAEETKPSRLKGEALEVASINKYGEHTMSIKNHLFQDQATIDAYCAIYLAAFKDPKWYTTYDTPFNPVPLEKGDTLAWRKKYEAGGTPIEQRGIIRDIQINDFVVTYKNEKVA